MMRINMVLPVRFPVRSGRDSVDIDVAATLRCGFGLEAAIEERYDLQQSRLIGWRQIGNEAAENREIRRRHIDEPEIETVPLGVGCDGSYEISNQHGYEAL